MKPINAEETVRLGNGINHELCMKFVQSGYDLGVIDEGLQAKDGQA